MRTSGSLALEKARTKMHLRLKEQAMPKRRTAKRSSVSPQTTLVAPLKYGIGSGRYFHLSPVATGHRFVGGLRRNSLRRVKTVTSLQVRTGQHEGSKQRARRFAF